MKIFSSIYRFAMRIVARSVSSAKRPWVMRRVSSGGLLRSSADIFRGDAVGFVDEQLVAPYGKKISHSLMPPGYIASIPGAGCEVWFS